MIKIINCVHSSNALLLKKIINLIEQTHYVGNILQIQKLQCGESGSTDNIHAMHIFCWKGDHSDISPVWNNQVMTVSWCYNTGYKTEAVYCTY